MCYGVLTEAVAIRQLHTYRLRNQFSAEKAAPTKGFWVACTRTKQIIDTELHRASLNAEVPLYTNKLQDRLTKQIKQACQYFPKATGDETLRVFKTVSVRLSINSKEVHRKKFNSLLKKVI